MQATAPPFSVVCIPGPRYQLMIFCPGHRQPRELFPGHFHLALGSGEALNERIMGAPGPQLDRHVRLRGCGPHTWHWGPVRWGRTTGTSAFWVELHARPAVPPKIFRAAVTAETARWVDGLLTVGGAPEAARQRLEAFAKGGAGKPVILQVALAYARDQVYCAGVYEQWRIMVSE